MLRIKIASPWKAPVDKIDSRMSPFCVYHTKCNSAILLKQLTLVAAGAIASRVSDVEKRKPFSLGRMTVSHLPLIHAHARTYAQMDKHN